MTVFGITGDLAKRLLFPSLYNLAAAGALPDDFRLIGVGRRAWNDQKLRAYLRDTLRRFLGAPSDARVTGWLAQRIFYQMMHFDEQAGFEALGMTIRRVARRKLRTPNRLYYLAVAPEFFEPIVRRLGHADLTSEEPGSWARVIVEKPFGHDLASAAALNHRLLNILGERQIYRIDHFAGKDAVQDLAVFRFSNAFIEPLWHRSLIDSVQITASETVGVEQRAQFYERSGALRDMVPNHLMELLSLIAMEPPVSFSVEHMRAKQVELLQCVRQIRPRDVGRFAVRGQYSAGKVGRKPVPAYRREAGVSRRSTTETYVALRVEIDNWRWSGVPFFLRTGKRLAKSVTEIAVQFRPAPARLFPNIASGAAAPNAIVFEMKPAQGIHIDFCARAPGLENRLMSGDMAFEFPAGPFGSHAKGYERPLRDAMLGDPILFPGTTLIEQGWKLVQPLLDAWSGQKRADVPRYAAGSQGPREAERLLAQSGHSWRALG
ncbi:MAG TPA: glucose-6-phosphate dehydrogenase [Steroidobacteraceae bacterium]